jgi:regulatory protein
VRQGADPGPRTGTRTAEDEDEDVDADPETVARTIVLRKLAAQARTRHELAKALAARQVPEEIAQQVLDRMESVGLVDDAAFARDWVESRQQRRHLSKSALRRELQTKGVDRDQIEQAVADVGGEDELEAAEALAGKKLAGMSGLPREVQYRRLAGMLARRGFGSGVMSTVLSKVLRPGDEQD